jgi:hypothetical protein
MEEWLAGLGPKRDRVVLKEEVNASLSMFTVHLFSTHVSI